MNEQNYDFLGVEGLSGDTMIPVTNMSRSHVGYTLKELNNRTVSFTPNAEGRKADRKIISFHELYTLFNAPGGEQLIWDSLRIESDLAREALGLPTSEEIPEMGYDKEKVLDILKNGTEDEILDMLEFGPFYIAEWVKDLIRKVDSSSKRQLIGHLFKLDVDRMEENLKHANEDPKSQGYAELLGEKSASSRRKSGAEESVDTQGRTRRVPN